VPTFLQLCPPCSFADRKYFFQVFLFEQFLYELLSKLRSNLAIFPNAFCGHCFTDFFGDPPISLKACITELVGGMLIGCSHVGYIP
jgi:hypothetical protein